MNKKDYLPTNENIAFMFDKDMLNRNDDVIKFIQIIDSIEENYVIGVDGEWGSGKTFFVKQVKAILNQLNKHIADNSDENLNKILDKYKSGVKSKGLELPRHDHYVVYYDAWEHDDSDDPIASILIQLVKETGVAPEYKDNIISIVDKFINLKTGKSFSDLLDIVKKNERIIEEENNIELHDLVSDFLESIIKEKADRLVIIIDELDRCKPSYAISALERIKHYFNNDMVTFILSTNIKELSCTVSNYYGLGFDGLRYLDKFFDLRLSLRKPNDLSTYLSYCGINSTSGHSYETVCCRVINEYNFELREIARYAKLIRLSMNMYRNIRLRFENQSMFFLYDLFVPVLIGLKMKDMSKYMECINGKDVSPFVDILNEDIMYGYLTSLLNENETYSKEPEKTLVSREQKIKEIYDFLFPFNQNSWRNGKTVGTLHFEGNESEYVLNMCNLLSGNLDLNELK